MKAVSYTHLDVYKRQEYDFVSYEDLQLLKDILFNQEILLKIKNL